MNKTPNVITLSDQNGRFTRYVQKLVTAKRGSFLSSKVVITAGPFRDYKYACNLAGNTLSLDFRTTADLSQCKDARKHILNLL